MEDENLSLYQMNCELSDTLEGLRNEPLQSND